jgi:hypothetical protein
VQDYVSGYVPVIRRGLGYGQSISGTNEIPAELQAPQRRAPCQHSHAAHDSRDLNAH